MQRGWQVAGAVAGGIALVIAAVAVITWVAWPQLLEYADDRGPSPAMKECMSTCMTWQLVGSLYHRGICRDCEDLDVCKGQKQQPTPMCMDVLTACYHRNKCIAAARVACDKRCAGFIANYGPGKRF